jgi:hypothetical protein
MYIRLYLEWYLSADVLMQDGQNKIVSRSAERGRETREIPPVTVKATYSIADEVSTVHHVHAPSHTRGRSTDLSQFRKTYFNNTEYLGDHERKVCYVVTFVYCLILGRVSQSAGCSS